MSAGHDVEREYLPGGDELRRRRVKLSLSQRDVARQLGVSQSAVSHIDTSAEPVAEWVIRGYAAFLDQVESERRSSRG